MSAQRLVGLVLFAVGIVLLIFGIHASQSVVEQVVSGTTGHVMNKTMWYIIGGVLMIIGGGALMTLGRRPR